MGKSAYPVVLAALCLFVLVLPSYGGNGNMENLKVLPQPYPKMLENYYTRLADGLLYGKDVYNSKSDWERRRKEVRKGLLRALNPFPEEKCPLNAKITGRIEHEDYVIEKLLFESRPGFYVTAAVYVPKNAKFPAPAILCPHGHWQDGRYHPVVQSRMIGLAKRGYIALSLDKVGYNQREPEGPHRAPNLFLVGMTVQGIQVWDNMRAIDYLCSREDVDPERIGCTGASGGGNQTMYVSAIDERIKASVPVCSVEMVECYVHKAGCMCETTPGIIRIGDLVDVCGLVAPRALMLVHGALDGGFLIDSARKAHLRLQRIYSFHDPAKLSHFVAYSGHDYNKEMREAVYAWFDKWLMQKEGPYPKEGEIHPEENPATTLKVCENGLPEDCDSMVKMYQRISEKLPPRADVSSAEEWKAERQNLHATFAECLGGWPEPLPFNTHIVETGDFALGEGLPTVKAEKLYFYSELDILIPAVLFHPPHETTEGFDVEVIVDHRGKEKADSQVIASTLKTGKGVFIMDVRATGETATNKDSILYFSSVSLGRPLLGMQAWDVRRSVDYLCSRDDVRSVSVHALDSPISGMAALIAAATNGRISGIKIDKLLLTYRMQDDFSKNAYLVIPNILKCADVADIAAMVAPRPLEVREFINADNGTPSADEIAAAFERCSHIYGLLGSASSINLFQ